MLPMRSGVRLDSEFLKRLKNNCSISLALSVPGKLLLVGLNCGQSICTQFMGDENVTNGFDRSEIPPPLQGSLRFLLLALR